VLINSRNLPTTEALLVSGGDARIALDSSGGLNKYGCQPYPDAELLAFGSSTASVISQPGFAAVSRLRKRWLDEGDAFELAREMQHIRVELLSDVADLGARLVFATSGTDAHFMAAQYAARETQLTVVMVEEAETGSGVAAALSASFKERGGKAAGVINVVPLRLTDGMPRPAADIDADVSMLVADAAASGRHVLLVMVDQSKTGMIAPTPACVLALHRRHPGHVDVLVDACQFRISKPTLRAYLEQGFMVAITGSKFITGPSFSAALLLPAQFEQRLEVSGGIGLLLRWEAALVEYRRFRNLPQSCVVDFLQGFGQAVQQRLASDPRFEPLAVPPLDRSPLIEMPSWDHLPSIFPFLLYRAAPDSCASRVPLSREETLQVYCQLQVDMSGDVKDRIAALRCQFGQPVACGVRGGIAVSALRLCLSARLISDAAGKKGISGVIDDALAALDKTAWLVDRLKD
jgi:hypothetical protein